MCQAITWTNAYPIHWCIYVALGGDELIKWWCYLDIMVVKDLSYDTVDFGQFLSEFEQVFICT